MISQASLVQSATKKEAETTQFFKKIKKQKPKQLDNIFHQIHEEIFEQTNCLTCANCCKTTSPIFYQKDIERIAKRLKITPQKFIETYLYLDSDKDYVLQSAPCPFLDHDNYCSIYNDRPTACKEYPHTNRKKIIQLLDLTLKNTFVCPAVFEIVEKLKNISLK